MKEYWSTLSLIFNLLLFAVHGSSQIPQLDWGHCYGGDLNDYSYSCKIGRSGYIVAGCVFSSNGDITNPLGPADAWVMKLDTLGNILWRNSYGGSSSDFFQSIDTTFDGGFIAAGFTLSNDHDVSGNHGMSDYWIVKLDSNGVIQWQKCYGGTDVEDIKDIHQTTDSGYILAGNTYSTDGDVIGQHSCAGCDPDVWVLKLDKFGNLQWQRCLGSALYEYCGQITETYDHSFVVCSIASVPGGDVAGLIGGSDFWVVKLDSTGSITWARCYGGLSDDAPDALTNLSDSTLLITGETNSNDIQVSGNHGANDVWSIKLDYGGNLIWQKCYGGSTYDWAVSVNETPNHELVYLGNSGSFDGNVTGAHGYTDFWVFHTDSIGNFLGGNCFGGSDEDLPHSICVINNESYLTTGETVSFNGQVTDHHAEIGDCTLFDCRDIWTAKISFVGTNSISETPSKNEIQISPNPTKDILRITTNKFPESVNVYSITGNYLKQFDLKAMNESINISNFSSGIYFLKTENGTVYKIVKY
ncbi:MAG: T9SS type A sorting domain-containing protein [Bacteroidia bacterium]|nr:T9SS type A sorting domain-containing protein [Bacteroidia bacterium]MBP6650280.1 T9SS type A sorting domain-containing protein [Bacteroidia bacterium]